MGRNISGVLEVVVTSGSEYLRNVRETLYSMEIEIPTHSKKQYEFTIYMDSFIHPLTVRLRHAGKTIISRSINLRPHFTDKPLALFLDTGMEYGMVSTLPEKMLPVYARSRFFPRTWYGLEGVEMVIMNSDALLNLNGAQFSALKAWLERGGHVIISGSLNYGALFNKEVSSILPAKVLGTKRITALNSLKTFCGEDLTSPEPFLILNTTVEDASILLKEDTLPIIFRRDMGLGGIIFTAFDFLNSPFRDWAGQRAFWAKIYSLAPVMERMSLDRNTRTITHAMLSSIPERSPKYGASIFFIILYLLLILSLFYLFTKAGTGRKKLLSALVSTIMIFNIAAYALFFDINSGKDPSFNSLLYLRLSGNNEIGQGQFILGLYSLRKRDISIRPLQPLPFIPIIPDTLGEDRPRVLILHQRGGEQTLEVHLEKWSHRFLKAEASLAFHLRGEAVLDGDELVISIKNGTRLPFMGFLIFFKDRFITLAGLPRDNGETIRLPLSSIEKRAIYTSEMAGNLIKKMLPEATGPLLERLWDDIMKEFLESIGRRYQSKGDRILLFGWTRAHAIPLIFEPNLFTGEGVLLLEWEIPLKDLKSPS